MKYQEIKSIKDIFAMAPLPAVMQHYAFCDIDFTVNNILYRHIRYEDCMFLGCTIPDLMSSSLSDDCVLFPKLQVPYNVFPSELYDAGSLYAGFDWKHPETFDICFDHQVYSHYLQTGKRVDDIKESLARSLHDHAITNAMYSFLDSFDPSRIIGIMGGHGMLRTDPIYRKIIQTSKYLTEHGYLMISGGGPGAMEATHVGAWLAGYPDMEVDRVVKKLSVAPTFRDKGWLESAFETIHNYPQTTYVSLAIPTWLYGHEPSTPFATHIAKYFENSIRENEILSIAQGGVIYTPGSAGTMQEVFQDAAQNHYLNVGYASPMIFFGTDYWTKQMPVYTLLEQLVSQGKYKNLFLCLTDSVQKVTEVLTEYSYQVALDKM